ncbi:hypothetical protein [Legionella sp. CNM-4043-24]|uniref:hypothetical protein n=1 Tax=Legionella sp. CNM-4043-24 TaxID=3421646 RepID=UPI00403AAE16
MKSRTEQNTSISPGNESNLVSQLRYVEAIDSYVQRGKKTGTLVIDSERRHDFFTSHPHVHHLLQREQTNPLLEEGAYWDKHSRARLGEYYLTYEALTLLIEARKQRRRPASSSGPSYNTKRMFVIKNNESRLRAVLEQLVLKDKDDVKLICITGIHPVACYIRKEGEHLKCMMVDSEGGDTELALLILSMLQKAHPGIVFYMSTTLLQKDYYSCATFAFKSLMYFVKHGAEVFPWLEQKEVRQSKKDHRILRLSPTDLMPTLLKMTQDLSVLSDSALATLVSHKRQTSLRDYINQHLWDHHGKPINTAALLKKYRYFSLLERYITRIIANDHINPEPDRALPIPLFKRHESYSLIRKHTPLSIQHEQSVLDTCQDIVSFLDSKETVEPSISLQKTLNHLQNTHPDFVQKYKSKFHKNSFYGEYKKADLVRMKKLLFIAALFETNDHDHVKLYMQFANKLITLFTQAELAVLYLKKYSLQTSRQPIHDACLFRLPIAGDGSWDNPYWAQLVMDFGERALSYLPWAARLDRLRQEQASLLETQVFDSPLEQFDFLMQHYTYPRSSENPALAELCRTHMIPEQQFNSCLELAQYNKPFDLLPDILLRGEELGSFLSGYYLKKLPAGDLTGYLLGEYTACCQTLGKQGEACAIHGMHSLMSGFYVIYNQHHQIVAQCWAWIGTSGELVLDSFERSHSNKNFLCKPFVTALAERCVQQGFKRVLIGLGNTPKMGLKDSMFPAKAYDPCSYSDAAHPFQILAVNYPSVLSQFQAYAGHNDLSFAKFEHLFAHGFSDGLFEKGLMELIDQNRLTFAEFVALTGFCYRGIYDFLHETGPDNGCLLQRLFDTFGPSMAPFLMLKSRDQEALIDVIIRLEHMDLLAIAAEITQQTNATPLLSTSPDAPFYRMAHGAVKSNSIRVLRVLHERYFQTLSWDEYIALPDHNGLTVLSQAAVSDRHALVQTMISLSKDNRKLHKLLKKEHGHINVIQNDEVTPNGVLIEGYRCAIPHYLAEKNDVETFKLIEQRMEPQALCELLDQKASIFNWHKKSWYLPPALYALKKQSYDFARYLMVNFYSKPALSALMVHQSNEKKSIDKKGSIIGLIIHTNQLELLHFLRSVHVDEVHWTDTLLTDINGFNALDEMMRADSLDSALAVFNDIRSFECFHRIMTKKKGALNLLLNRAERHYRKKPFFDFLLLILNRYSEHPASLSEAFDMDIAAIILKQRNLNVFKQFVTLLSQDPTLFMHYIRQEYAANLLHLIFAEFDDKTGNNPDFIEEMSPFVHALFNRCSPEQVKTLLCLCSSIGTWIYIFPSISVPLFRYIVKTVKAIEDSTYQKNWFSLKNSALHSIFKNTQESYALTQDLLDGYIEQHGAEHVAEHFKKKRIDFVWDFVSQYHNIRLLQYVYPLTKADSHLYEGLLERLLNDNGQISPATAWFMEQPEISAEHLLEYLNHFKKHRPDASAYSYLFVFTQLWNISMRKGVSDELALKTIQQHVFEIQQKLSQCLSDPVRLEPSYLPTIETFKTLLNSWLERLSSEPKEVSESVSTPGSSETSLTFF